MKLRALPDLNAGLAKYTSDVELACRHKTGAGRIKSYGVANRGTLCCADEHFISAEHMNEQSRRKHIPFAIETALAPGIHLWEAGPQKAHPAPPSAHRTWPSQAEQRALEAGGTLLKCQSACLESLLQAMDGLSSIASEQ